MVKYCCFGNCRSDSRPGRPGFDVSVTFFRFPKPCVIFRYTTDWTAGEEKKHISCCNECSLCKSWMISCKRTDSKFLSLRSIKNDTYICSKHFEGNPRHVNFKMHRPKSSAPMVPSRRNQRYASSSTQCSTIPTGESLQESVACSSTNCTFRPVNEEGVVVAEMECDIIPPTVRYENENVADSSEDSAVPEPGVQSVETSNTGKLGMVDKGTQVDASLLVSSCTLTTQTSLNITDIDGLEKEIGRLKGVIQDLKKKLETCKSEKYVHSIDSFSKAVLANEKMCQYYTGLSFKQFFILKRFVSFDSIDYWGLGATVPESSRNGSSTNGTRKTNRKLSIDHEILLVFLRLRQGLLLEDMSYRFGLSESTISRTVTTWIQCMYLKFDTLRGDMFCSREKIKQNLPDRFRNFNNIRIIIDCAEIRCEKPSNFEHQGNSYSEYKAHTTFKLLIGCAPNGAVMFVSDLFEGSISDREIVKNSGLIERLEEGDMVLADRGFTIKDLTDEKGAVLKIPAFLKGRDCLTPQEEISTKLIAANRIFVEHVVGRLKNFRIFQRTVPQTMRHVLSQAVFVCACLLNFQPPFVK